jgi:superfamily II DNA or RNA helicase
MELRPYQEKILNDCRDQMRNGVKRILICLPTGGGKTAISTKIISNAAQKGLRCIFLVHRVELIEQTAATFIKFGLKFGIIAAGYEDDSNDHLPIQIASISTIYRRRKSQAVHPYDIDIVDEAVHISSKAWLEVIELWPNAYRIGLTATPRRLSGEGFTDIFDTMVLGPTTSWLIENQFLSSYKFYGPQVANFSKVKVTRGEYDTIEVEHIINKIGITGGVIEHYKRLAHNKRAIVFCASTEHSKAVAEQFNQAGYQAAHVDALTQKTTRKQIMADFRAGTIKVLTNVNLFIEGVDVPALEACILLRPTKSLALYLQAVGRALRYQDDKTAIIIDHVGNCQTHGLPNEQHDWSLNGHSKKEHKEQEQGVAIKVCQSCYAVYKPSLKACPYCGATGAKEIKTPKQIAGELEEIKQLNIKARKQEESRAVTFADFVEIGKKRGYANPTGWAYIRAKARGLVKI